MMDHNYIIPVDHEAVTTCDHNYAIPLEHGVDTSWDHNYSTGNPNITYNHRDAASVDLQNRHNETSHADMEEAFQLPPTTISVHNDKPFELMEVPGDGNCFFHCLSSFLYDDFHHSQILRENICRHIFENWHIWQSLVQATHYGGMDQTLYNIDMLHYKGFATSTEVMAACHVLQMPITVWVEGLARRDGKAVKVLAPQTYGREHRSRGHMHVLLVADHYRRMTLQESQPVEEILLKSPAPEQFAKRKRKDQKSSTQKKRYDFTQRRINAITNLFDQARRLEIKTSNIEEEILTNSANTTKDCVEALMHLEQITRANITNKLRRRIKAAEHLYRVQAADLKESAIKDNDQLNKALSAIRTFELEQMSYVYNTCTVCHERRLAAKPWTGNVCPKCKKDKKPIKMFSNANHMDPGSVPPELQNLSLIEQQLICRIAPAMSVHLLKHGGLGASGHCVTFPQEINEPAQIFPRLPEEINIIRVRRLGRADTSKDFNVRRSAVEKALLWLKQNSPPYQDILICRERLDQLPVDGELNGIRTLDTNTKDYHQRESGYAFEQVDPGDIGDLQTTSGVLLPEESANIREKVENIVNDVIGEDHGDVTSRRGKITIPWPTRSKDPVSEFTTANFFTLAFPTLFPDGTGDFRINRPRTCESMTEWADHLLWYKDGRFAKHKFFKFVVHNIIMRKRSIENSIYAVKQQLGDAQLSIEELQEMITTGDSSIAKKVLYFGGDLRGTSQYWARRGQELRALIKYQINEGKGLPGFFTTGSCAEFYFKPLRRLLKQYMEDVNGEAPDLDNKSELFKALQDNTHIVGHYFDLRTQSYFANVVRTVFNVNAYWYRYEFAKSRGMIHWHGLCWRQDREPHNLLYEAVQNELSDTAMAEELSNWASNVFGMTAMHPAGTDSDGKSNTHLWPPPEGSATACAEDDNPLLKLLLDISDSQDSLLEDHLQLCNKVCLHRCSDYCLTKKGGGEEKHCRMEFGTESAPGKQLRDKPEIVLDKNKSLRLEMKRDHPQLVQHSQFHLQGWRANGDISIILSKSDPVNPSIKEIIATERYVTSYACKGNESTGTLADLFNDMVNSTEESSGATAKSVITKLLMKTVKRDISAVEASYELSSFPLYCCSHLFKSISLSGIRVLERSGDLVTKTTPLDKYLNRAHNDHSSFYQHVCNMGFVPVIAGNGMYPSWPLTEEYARMTLVLHWPNWRSIPEIKGNLTWTEQMELFLDGEVCPNFIKAEVQRSRQSYTRQNHLDESDEESALDTEQPSWCELLRPNAAYEGAVTDFEYEDGGPEHDWARSSNLYPTDAGKSWSETTLSITSNSNSGELKLPSVALETLNEDQRFAFTLVINTIKNFKEGSPLYKPLRLVIAGAAGSGKSYLIDCLVYAIRTLYQKNKVVQVVCPTGNSANLISGVTMHRFLKLPIGPKVKRDLSTLNGDAGEALQENCRDLLCLLVDEHSLIGCNSLGWMEYRLRQGKCSDDSWGGIPVVVFFGDDVQLPPVCDSPVYMGTTKTAAGLHGSMTWKSFETAIKLSRVVRQNLDQEEFKNVLNSLRTNTTTSHDAKWLQKFQWDNLRQTHGEDLLQRMDRSGLFVFPTHELEWNHNKEKLLKQNVHSPIAKVRAESRGMHAKSASSDKAGGLAKEVYLCEGARVMLTVNIQVEWGLFNGAVGEIQHILYPQGLTPNDCQPSAVIVDFPKYSGPPFLPEYPTFIPIRPVERRLECDCCVRKQIPLRLGWGTTIHRCQGMTIGDGEVNKYVIINPGPKSFESKTPGGLYVALSRAKSAGTSNQDPEFAFHKDVLLNEDRVRHIVNTPTVRARNKEIDRLDNLANVTKASYPDQQSTKSFLESVQFVNQSLEE